MVGYIMKRKLRHIQSLKLYNVAIPLIRNGYNSNINFIKANSCFFTMETTRGDFIYISENEPNVLRSIQFNNMKFEGSPINHFILNIFVQIPKEMLVTKHHQDSWTKIVSYSIDLSNVHHIDPEMISQIEMNVPVFKMKDGYFIPEQFTINNSFSDKRVSNNHIIHPHGGTPKYNSSTIKPSINYNNLIKLNKLIEYQKQINKDKDDLSQKIENNLVIRKHFKTVTNERFQTIEKYIEKTEKRLTEKRTKIELLKKDISKIETPELPVNKPSSTITIEQDEYGNIYSNLIQVRERASRVRRRRINKLLTVFKDIPFTNKDINLFEYTNSDIESLPEKGLTFRTINHESILKFAQESEENRRSINTQLGNYALLLSIVTNKIANIRIPYTLSYYGSSSIIDSHYPLYLMDLQSAKHFERFKKAISLLNVNINQINQFLQV